MINLSLYCEKSHEFESMFKDHDGFEKLANQGLLSCPLCGSNNIKKGLSAPFVQSAKTKAKHKIPLSDEVAKSPAPDVAAPAADLVQVDQEHSAKGLAVAELIEKVKALKQHIESTHKDVGDQFPEMARQIHYGEREHEKIIGKADIDEAKALIQEGINLIPLPFIDDEDKQ
ncbi:MAG: DUF1178 family protein [Alphaproteobacteria bacterium]